MDTSQEESRKIFDAFAGQVGSFFDKANQYTEGSSDEYVSEFKLADREQFVITINNT